MPKISVIVPVYNVEPYLTECIDSILAQTYRDFELILVDDGSTDGCHAICDAYGEKHDFVKVIHQSNKGLSAARNAGIDASKGEYLTFIDSDDMIKKDYLEKLLMPLELSYADVTACKIKKFTSNEELQDVGSFGRHERVSGIDAVKELYDLRSKNNIVIESVAKMYAKDIVGNIRFPVGKLHEDDATTPKFVYAAKSVFIMPDELYLYRQRAGSIMNSGFSIRRYDGVDAIDSCIDFFKKANETEIVALARQTRCALIAKLYIMAALTSKKDIVPPQYRMTERAALTTLRRILPDDTYTWYLAQLHPRWLRPHAYLRKIKKMLGIRCN